MKEALLLVVQDHFDVRGRGLIVAPSLCAPHGQGFPFTAEVDIAPPSGGRLAAVALFSVPMGGRSSKSNCVMMLRDMTKSEVPIDSRVLVDEAVAATFRSANHEQS
jgi:hypothetical protein